MTPEEWLIRRSFRGADFDPERLAARKRAQGLTVSVCLPARDVEDTVGAIVAAVRERWVERVGLVDELLVIDGRSSDGTAAAAAAAGARVLQDDEILPGLGARRGKGEALWKSLAASTGDLVVWLDADVRGFDPAFVPGLLGPLLLEPEVGYVKAVYRRPLGDRADDGGRVTEICARPLINLFYPELAGLAQPLSGEAAGRRALLERVPFMGGYAVEIGLLIDILRGFGLAAMAQVDLGERRHRHQETAALGEMAYAITQAVVRRLAQEGRVPPELALAGPYRRPVAREGGYALDESPLALCERPAMASLAGYRERMGAAAVR